MAWTYRDEGLRLPSEFRLGTATGDLQMQQNQPELYAYAQRCAVAAVEQNATFSKWGVFRRRLYYCNGIEECIAIGQEYFGVGAEE